MGRGDGFADKKIGIVVIDSGIDTTISDLALYVKKSTGFRINSEGYIVEDESMPHVYEHGTAVAMIIRHLCPEVEIRSINIFDKELVTDGRIMLCALDRAVDYKPDIIHMSLGTTRWIYKFSLAKLVKKALQNNTVIVSAANNEGLKSYPAYLKRVIGVKGAKIQNVDEYFFEDKFFYAPYGIKGINGIGELEFKESAGSSMAAAYITGHLAAIKARHKIADNTIIAQYMKNQIGIKND